MISLRLTFCSAFCNLVLASVSIMAQTPLIVAHRGASYDAPENTLPAFNLAWEKNADAIEGDFYLTRDNQIVCIHDKSTKKYCELDLVVAKSTAKELRRLDVGAYKHPKFRGTKIPLISEVLATVPPGKKIYVEVKCGPEIVPQLVKDLEASKLKSDQIVIISFNSRVIKQIKSVKPDYKAYWLSSFKNEKSRITPSPASVIATLKDIRANGFSSSHQHLSKAFIDEIEEAGFEHHVWTVNDSALAKRLSAWRVKSITTDRPALIRKAVEE